MSSQANPEVAAAYHSEKELTPEERDEAINAALERIQGFPEHYVNIFKIVTSKSVLVNPLDVERVITIAKEKNLSVDSLRVSSAKPYWIKYAFHCPSESRCYKSLKKYYVVAPLRNHWRIVFQTDLNDWVQVELLTQTYEKADEFKAAIEYKTNNKQVGNSHYLLPCVTVNATCEEDKDIHDCNIKWADLMILVMLDPQTFTEYDLYINNCQQWAERVMQGLGLPCPTSIFPESSAQITRSLCLIL